METNRKIVVITLILFGAIALAMAILFLWPFSFGKISSLHLQSNNFKFGEIAPLRTNHFKLQKAILVSGSKKTKTMGAEGGILKLVDQKGTKITLNIPAGALEKETDITLAELSGSPISNLDASSGSSLGQGIFLGPVGIQFKKPSLITFDFNPQNEQSLQQVPASQVSAGTPLPAVPVDDGLTEDERTRHQNAPRTQIGERSGVLHTNSAEDRAGDNVFLAPSVRSQEAGEIETAVSDGGTYSANGEIAKADAKALAESIFENPNATSEQILEAWSMAQQWGLDDVEGRAKEKMKIRIDDETRKISENCENENRIKVSKKTILQLQGLAQQLGMNQQEQKLGELLQSCRAYYFIDIKYYNVDQGHNIIDEKFSASVCGFIDEEWKATYDDVVTNPEISFVGWAYHFVISGLHLKPGGGYTDFIYSGTSEFASPPSKNTYENVLGGIEFDGTSQVNTPLMLTDYGIPRRGQVKSQKQCVVDSAPL